MRPFDPRLLRVLPAARGAVAFLGLLGVLGGALAIGQAFAITRLVVDLVARQPLQSAIVATALVLGGRMVATGLTEVVAARAGAQVSTALRERLLAHWLTLPAERRPDAARALTLATGGATSVEPYVARYLPTLVASVVLPGFAIVAMTLVDWLSALIVVVTVPLLPLFAALIGRATHDATQRRWRTSAALAGHFLDVVRGLPTLVSYGRGRTQVGTIRTVSERHRESTMATLKVAFLSSAALELLATLSVAIVAVSVGLRLAGGSMPLGTAMTAILLAPEAYWPIRRVGAEFHNAADGAEAIKAILDELDAPAGVPTRHVGADASVSGLTYSYPGSDHPVIAGLDAA
ncbi:MAG TPA: ABC transporter transmembrane domain-containing protein, partial [Candidatus Lustribacter sp.]|nr:ABC transporter transmembrane domain-containing protein [Candidatus Lustribacter sp.]